MNFLITGASRGIGLELTLFALEAGHTVFAFAREPNKARYLSQAKVTFQNKLEIIPVDVTDEVSLFNAKDIIADTPIDILINNAGVINDGDGKLSEVTVDQLQLIFQINTFAPLIVSKIFIENLKKSKNPRLINITSLMGSIADNNSGAYYPYRMSKAALNMFTKSFSLDYPDIITLSLHPGWVRTEMGGAQAPLLPRESARGLFQVIIGSSLDQTGQFFDYRGKKLPW